MDDLRRFLAGLGTALLAVLFANPVSAQGLTARDWSYRLTAYGWFPTVEGEFKHTPPASNTSLNLDANDYLDNLRFAFFLTAEARTGRYGILTDYIYLDLDAEKGGSRDVTLTGPLGRVDLPVGAFAGVDFRLRGWAWTLAGTYGLVDDRNYESQLLAGLRYLKVNTTVDVHFTGNIGSLPPAIINTSATNKPDVWDAIVGAKGRYRFADGRWYVPYYVDIGIGQSDLTWQAMIGVGYTFPWGEAFAAYRHLSYKFDHTDGLEDLTLSGPGLGVSFRF
jgi:hypothetical protein